MRRITMSVAGTVVLLVGLVVLCVGLASGQTISETSDPAQQAIAPASGWCRT